MELEEISREIDRLTTIRAEMLGTTLDDSIRTLGLIEMTNNALEKAGIYTIRQLVEADQGWLEKRYLIGPKGIRLIRATLKERGLHLEMKLMPER